MTGRGSVAPNASIQQTTGLPPQETKQQPPPPGTSSQEAHDVRSYGPAEAVGRQLSSTPRGIGVQNILNTTEGDYQASGVNTLYVPKTRGAREPPPQNQLAQQYQAHGHYPPALTGATTESFFERRPENRLPPHELDQRLQAPVTQAAQAKRPYEDVSSSDYLSGPASKRLPNSLPHTPNPPGYEHEPIEVHVDTSQGSRKASEKRERNAQASNRHRAKRRQMAQDDKKHIQQLQEEQEELERRIRELMALADHYRADRNRLRDIVRATPVISDHAAGPPSPRITEYTSGASPMLHHAPHGPGTLRDFREHSSEASSMDRTVQRPVMEDRQEPYAQRHGSTTPSSSAASLPHGAPYMSLPRPDSASSSTGMGERLPSLRTLEGPPPPVADGRVWERDLVLADLSRLTTPGKPASMQSQ
ncbi:uncharacterized protein J7T54_000039 [Emericellopsis cladophorae]|uniref:BZIP domain-containing protein n=1 Tax=Emericellopsis cladophorae TaxID=2686198 RepID=A0A9P9XYC0_9HYPO|nr:uncharacterized protein J7T54_000039 [Emericellopsis cladophorae]KAI6780133.1 hypothetical protein J7T54_000039 [Emericellopsis cladophorae]